MEKELLIKNYENGAIKEVAYIEKGTEIKESGDFLQDLMTCQKYVGTVIQMGENGMIEWTGNYTDDGKEDGYFCIYSNGSLTRKALYRNGKNLYSVRYSGRDKMTVVINRVWYTIENNQVEGIEHDGIVPREDWDEYMDILNKYIDEF